MREFAPSIELRAAKIPVIGALAHHHWFVVEHEGRKDRWEIWQFADRGGVSWGHLHKNLLAPERGVGNGPSWLVEVWSAKEALDLIERVEHACEEYPWCDRYRLWPGPNSNTFVQWVLEERIALSWRAWGERYSRRAR